jgi:hypothetical protein
MGTHLRVGTEPAGSTFSGAAIDMNAMDEVKATRSVHISIGNASHLRRKKEE